MALENAILLTYLLGKEMHVGIYSKHIYNKNLVLIQTNQLCQAMSVTILSMNFKVYTMHACPRTCTHQIS